LQHPPLAAVAAGGSAVAPPPHAEYWGNDADTVFVEALTTASKTSLQWHQEQLENTLGCSHPFRWRARTTSNFSLKGFFIQNKTLKKKRVSPTTLLSYYTIYYYIYNNSTAGGSLPPTHVSKTLFSNPFFSLPHLA
jgi:hypothetical protein